ncbi:MAG: HEPN domain-containing protein [Sphingobacteriales bacterium]
MNTQTTKILNNKEDIEGLKTAITAFRSGDLHEDQFRSVRTLFGVYTQRKTGGQMVRIKLPFGRVTFKQLLCLASVADEYSQGLLHFTTRQNAQIYNVNLLQVPELWTKLQKENITLRGAGGNTVRNVSASATAGIDPGEPFDVSPYASAVFEYFLHNPVCQEMGRKIKISFSATDNDTAYSFIHDLGFIPRIQKRAGVVKRGFKVMLGGSLGAQPLLAQQVNEFLPEDELIPFIEAVLRVFNQYGERNNKNRARLKFLLREMGIAEFMRLVKEQQIALSVKTYTVDTACAAWPAITPAANSSYPFTHTAQFEAWMKTNVFEQRQHGYYGVYISLPPGGDIGSGQIRQLVFDINDLVADDVRITVTQNLLLRFVKKTDLPVLFERLEKLGFVKSLAGTIADFTCCKGTETCNLAITNSRGLAKVLEEMIIAEYGGLLECSDVKIKIGGCMNACGHHAIASIGMHGSVIKAENQVLPAMQILLGGGATGEGEGNIADKIIKIPARRIPDALRLIMDHYKMNIQPGETFLSYYSRFGKIFYYQLLRPLASLTDLKQEDFMDWGQEEAFKTAIGTGECAGASVDFTFILLRDAEDKLEKAKNAFECGCYADCIHHAYTSLINTAKALLLQKGITSTSQHTVMLNFDEHFLLNTDYFEYENFQSLLQQINYNEPDEEFAERYFEDALTFIQNTDLIIN